MLGHWNIILRQAEEAARVGRFEEAYALANRPGVADHHHVVQFRSRLALDLLARATRRGVVDDLSGAIEDLDLAERIGAPPDSLAAARLNLADRVADEVRGRSGRRRAGTGALSESRNCRGTRSVDQPCGDRERSPRPGRRRSRKGGAASLAGRMNNSTGPSGWLGVQVQRPPSRRWRRSRSSWSNRQKGAAPKVEALYAALSEGKWPQILSAAEAVLAVVPEHPAARQWRSRAWQQIAAIGPAAAQLAAPRRPRTTGQCHDRTGVCRPTRASRAGPHRVRGHHLAERRCRGSGQAGCQPEDLGSRGNGRPMRLVAGPSPLTRPMARGRSPGSTRPAPRVGFCSGLTPSAAISSAWTTASSWDEPGPTAMPTFR